MTNALALLSQAESEAKAGDLYHASICVQRALVIAAEGSEDHARAACASVKLLLRSGRLAEAETLLHDIQVRYGRTSRVLCEVGQLKERQHDWVNAALAYAEAALTAPNQALRTGLYQNAAWAAMMNGSATEAAGYLAQAAASMSDDDTAAQNTLDSYLCMLIGDMDKALALVVNVPAEASAWAFAVAAVVEAKCWFYRGQGERSHSALVRAALMAQRVELQTGSPHLAELIAQVRETLGEGTNG